MISLHQRPGQGIQHSYMLTACINHCSTRLLYCTSPLNTLAVEGNINNNSTLLFTNNTHFSKLATASAMFNSHATMVLLIP